MAKKGDVKDIGGGSTRKYYDHQWDFVKDKAGNAYWRDKENHKTYEHDGSLGGLVGRNCLGKETDKFDDEGQDSMWDDD